MNTTALVLTAHTPLIVGALLLAGVMPTRAAAQESDLPEIAYTKRVLENGLTVIVHEDHKAPVVGVNIWYHVGSKNERPARTGFAHLFEHLMFNGSENADDDWFQAMAAMGATDTNGTTSQDRTNYFETVPTGALDRTLWLESDRMGHLLGAIDQAKLDEQRGVVQNEKRQGQSRPYSGVWEQMQPLLYPAGHPYSWSVIGSMEDLNAATVDDVGEWFKAYYGAANAVLVICGDVDTEEAFEKAAHYFGDIPPGPPVTRPETWIAKRTGTIRISIEERVPQARIHYTWNTPEWGATDTHLLELVANVLADGEGSRLHERLVRLDGLATDVVAFQDDGEIGSVFHLWATAADGIELATLEIALDDELDRFLAEGPTTAELDTQRVQVRAEHLRRTERVGYFGGKANQLARSEVFGGSPDAWRRRMSDIAAATPDTVRRAAVAWLSDGRLIAETRPIPQYQPATKGADRSAPPEIDAPPAAAFPTLQRTALDNGMSVVLAPRSGSALVQLDVLTRGGFAADPVNGSGTARLLGTLLPAGTPTRSAQQIRSELDELGARLNIDTQIDVTRITLSTLPENLASSIALVADIVQHPTFPADELELQRRAQLAAIAQERVSGWQALNRVLPRLLFGESHPHGVPGEGTGTVDDVSKITPEDLRQFHAARFRPGSTTIIVTGDASRDAVLPLLDSGFGSWAGGAAREIAIAMDIAPKPVRVILMDRPGAPQSIISAAQLAPARGDASELPFAVLNTVLGGSFVSRLNMNLREDKHWSYGARSMVFDMYGPRILSAGASVQTDKTAESLAEVYREMVDIAGARLPTAAEIETAKSTMTLTLPGRWETTGAVADSVAQIVMFDLADTYYDGYADRVRGVTVEQLAEVARSVHPEHLVYFVIGDLAKVEASIRELELGEVTVVDADGRVVETH